MAIRVEVMEDPFFMDGATKRILGDIYTEENDAKAQMYINAGWLKNADTGEQGDRIEGVSKMDVDDVIVKST